jgi:hypothetical protein
MTLPADIARCPGIGSAKDGWLEDCETCLHRLSPTSEEQMKPPAVIAFFCPFQIEES